MYNFITIMYDVFSYFGVLAKNQNTRDIRNIKNFSSHQHSLGDMFDELINIIDKEQVITAPVVSGYHACGEWLQEFRQLTTCFISARTKSVSQHTSRFGGIRIPVPLLTSFVFDKTPLFIKFADKRHIGTGDWRCGYFAW